MQQESFGSEFKKENENQVKLQDKKRFAKDRLYLSKKIQNKAMQMINTKKESHVANDSHVQYKKTD